MSSTENFAKLSWVLALQELSQQTDADAASVYQSILEHVAQGFGAKSGCLALHEADHPGLRIVAGIDIPAHVIGSRVALGSRVLGWVAEKREALLLNGDIASDDRFPKPVARTESARPGSALCWPLRVNEEVIGVVSVNRPAELPAFDREDLERGKVMLNLVGLALTNIRLREDQQRRIDALREANRALEEARVQLTQAEKLASVGQLAAGLAHEINNPIGFVNSNLSTLEKYAKKMLAMLAQPETLSAAAEEIEYLRTDIFDLIRESRDGIARVSKIVQGLRDSSSNLDIVDQPKPADLCAIVDGSIEMARGGFGGRCELRREYAEVPDVECVSWQLGQVFLNLLENAGQAMPEGGIVTVRIYRPDAGSVAVDVADNGPGIAPAIVSRVFDPFFTTKPVGQGTGLGLSVAYGIVKKHHGSIDVASEPGKGACFTVRLPVSQSQVESASAPDSWVI